jgi:8-oxo-dGTP pyrophosphatase MutT (NUDIX family)
MFERIRVRLRRRRYVPEVGSVATAPVAAPKVVRGAGGVIVNDDGEVLLVHRPKYDDWTFPKGKNERGESDQDCARREVEEETGVRCVLGDELTTIDYVDRKGRPKSVRYWLMTTDDEPVASNEVDDLRWVSSSQARSLLSYDRDREVLDAFLARTA